ncbi:MAG: hypothetical protein ACI8X5_002744 [Planctomycetota bacterium]|jgi:hypothetical protein
MKLLSLALLPALALLAGQHANAQTIYVGGLDTFFMEGDPTAGNFSALGACGGSIQSMVESYQDLYLGDVGGRVYLYHGNPNLPSFMFTNYVFDSPNDAIALADYGGTLLVGGTDGSVHMIDKRDGSVERTFNVPSPIGAIFRDEDTLFVGSPDLTVYKIDLLGGGATVLGTCAGQVHSMTLDSGELILGTPTGLIYKMDVDTGFLTSSFTVPNDAQALVMDGGKLLVGGSDGSILRVNVDTGAVILTLNSLGADVSALAISPAFVEPGIPYCFGIDCPCANQNATGGCTNSTGKGAQMRGIGSTSVLADDFTLTVDNMPTSSWGVVYMGALSNEINLGDGLLCAGAGYPLYRFQIQNSGGNGSLTLGPGIVNYAAKKFDTLGQINPGDTKLWQIWFRNPTGPCGSGFNTSNGYSVSFSQ